MIPGGDGKAPGEVADAPAGRGPSGLHAGLQGCPPAEAGPDRLAEPPGQERERDADLLDISPETVREWLRRYEERGINGLREGKNLVLDNYAIHRSRRVREFAEGEEGRRVALVFLPTYSPNLNIVDCAFFGDTAIQDAIGDVGVLSNDVLDVKPGTYKRKSPFNGVVDITGKFLDIIGRDPQNTILDGENFADSRGVRVADSLAAQSVLSNFTIRNAEFGIDVAVNTIRINNTRIENLIGPRRGVDVSTSNNHVIDNLTIGRPDIGLFIDPSVNVTVRDSRVGIHVQGTEAVRNRFINITNVTVNSSNETGILLEFSNDTNITNSRFVNFNRTPLTGTGQNVTALRARGANSGLNVTGNVIDNVSCAICSALGIDIDGIAPNGTVAGPASNVARFK
ncbi:MAG: transposase [Halobacteria archaeon]